ncbi:MAG: hypothetical protein WC841_02335 [Candidatus Shapirobacteria bacterium]|jgi:hypothetical protein
MALIDRILSPFGLQITPVRELVVRDSRGRIIDRHPLTIRPNGTPVFDASEVDTGNSQFPETRKIITRII